jgi:hypothetical protein
MEQVKRRSFPQIQEDKIEKLKSEIEKCKEKIRAYYLKKGIKI